MEEREKYKLGLKYLVKALEIFGANEYEKNIATTFGNYLIESYENGEKLRKNLEEMERKMRGN